VERFQRRRLVLDWLVMDLTNLDLELPAPLELLLVMEPVMVQLAVLPLVSWIMVSVVVGALGSEPQLVFQSFPPQPALLVRLIGELVLGQPSEPESAWAPVLELVLVLALALMMLVLLVLELGFQELGLVLMPRGRPELFLDLELY